MLPFDFQNDFIMNDTSKVVRSFEGVLGCFEEGTKYKKSPPTGPPDHLEDLSDEDLKSLQRTVYGENLNDKHFSYESIALVEDPKPIEVSLPTLKDLENLNVCGIDGSNQRVERSAFYFILARAAIVEFRYSTTNKKPYFYNKLLDGNAVIWVDGNVFSDEVSIHTTKFIAGNREEKNILADVLENPELPFLFRYSPNETDKKPSSHALGWAVKLQFALELACIKEIPTDVETVCIKDGPLFSTSVTPEDTIFGLNPIFSWSDQVLISCSKRVKDSRLLVEAIQLISDLREYWFSGQNITDQTLQQVSTDSILLPRLLHPGYRTPLMEAVPRSRKRVVKKEPRLMPLTCYYLSKHQPHTYIRIEVPKFMWERDPKKVEKAISIVAWQHELGHRAPLVQLASDLRCQLGYEKAILEKQTISHLYKNNLDFPEDY